jgi:hypothetical protein
VQRCSPDLIVNQPRVSPAVKRSTRLPGWSSHGVLARPARICGAGACAYAPGVAEQRGQRQRHGAVREGSTPSPPPSKSARAGSCGPFGGLCRWVFRGGIGPPMKWYKAVVQVVTIDNSTGIQPRRCRYDRRGGDVTSSGHRGMLLPGIPCIIPPNLT